VVKHTFDSDNAILYVHPESSLEKEDFKELAETVDPYIEQNGILAGLIIELPAGFPGWDNFGAMMEHFRFVRDHHKHIKKVGLVTDSKMDDLAERMASHFVAAQIRQFSATESEAAKAWIIADA
jgi:hypothetical protein